MAKLADAADLKSAGLKRPVGVRFPLPAPLTLAVALVYCGLRTAPPRGFGRLPLTRPAPMVTSRTGSVRDCSPDPVGRLLLMARCGKKAQGKIGPLEFREGKRRFLLRRQFEHNPSAVSTTPGGGAVKVPGGVFNYTPLGQATVRCRRASIVEKTVKDGLRPGCRI